MSKPGIAGDAEVRRQESLMFGSEGGLFYAERVVDLP